MMLNMRTFDSVEFARTIASAAEREFADLGLRLAVMEPPDRQGGDVMVDVRLANAHAVYRGECKRVATAAQLAVVSEQLQRYQRLDASAGGLLLTDYMSREQATRARSLGVEFIDASGNAYLRPNGALIWSVGNRRVPVDQERVIDSADYSERQMSLAQLIMPQSANTGSVAATKILYVLLSRPQAIADLTLRDVAQLAGVALGTVSAVIKAFEQRGWLQLTARSGGQTGKKGRIREPELLLQEFAVNYAARLRERITVRRYETELPIDPERMPMIPGSLWGGEVAADSLLGNYRPSTFTVFVDPKDRYLMRTLTAQYRLRQAPEGRFTIMERFWMPSTQYEASGYVAPPLIYAELMASAHTRAIERAAEVRDYWLKHDCGLG
ncbi:type IV toxin-antitoxin system AbiEi family antitoxin [Niveibacterium sp.]|uniref:type IV toxin-antitoxin system AbiEi family antitoxin n=1 Tax=Niveibacterium sp. TaxID=2017444 RepID=UPI0035B23921